MHWEDRLWLEKIFQEMAHIKEQGRLTLEKVIKIMADVIVTQEQLDQVNSGIAKIGADLQGFATDITAVGNDVEQVLTLLKNAQATGTRVDLTTAIGLLTQADQNLGVLDTKVQGLNTTMQAVTNPVVTPPPPVGPTITGVVTNADGSVTTTFSDGSTSTELNGTVTGTTPPTATPAVTK